MVEEGKSFEDWWVNPNLIDSEILKNITSNGSDSKLWTRYTFVGE